MVLVGGALRQFVAAAALLAAAKPVGASVAQATGVKEAPTPRRYLSPKTSADGFLQ
jgi:hypothetical protein